LPDELTTEEALKLCKELGELGLRWVTVSGGEALIRKDWHIIAKGLTDNGVTPLLISNGWLVDDDVIQKAQEAGIESFAMSIDGLRETHDFMRMPGSFDKIMSVYDKMENTSLVKAAITTVNKKNIGELEGIRRILIEKGVKLWQVQIGLPMGNFSENSDLALEPGQVEKIIDFAYDTINDKNLIVYLADCIGYYNRKEIAVRDKTFGQKNVMWTGCTAGKRSFGILHNGNILGCTSIRDDKFIEGNIRQTPLKEIWNNMQNFSWSRQMSKSKLKGFCNKCGYGDVCLGGCPNTRLTFNKDIYSENEFCMYNMAIKKAKARVSGIDNKTELLELGNNLLSRNEFQLAELAFARAIDLGYKDIDIYNNYGYISYMLTNYEDARKANEQALLLDPDNVYANKGMGLTLVKLEEVEEGLKFLRKSATMTDAAYMYPYYDLALTLIEQNRTEEAKNIIKEAKAKAPEFSLLEETLIEAIRRNENAS
jgi:radical SAM protein with 4Fe4S-binding SPASM domain